MIEISKAIKLVEQETRSLGSERVPLSEAVGRVLCEDIVSDSDLPPFDRSQMDGFAVIASDTKASPVELAIVGESAAGRGWHQTLKRGEAVRIMTGAPVPAGSDAVQKVELTRETDDGRTVSILEPTEKGRYMIRRASEAKKGKRIVGSGTVITENMIAVLAAFGYSSPIVGKRPRVAIMSTGSEIVDIAEKPGRDQIRNSNSVMLSVLCRKAGAETTVFPLVLDDVDALKDGIAAAATDTDIFVITGGVSVGKYDHTKDALAALGAKTYFDKLRLKPGKPMVFARLGETLVFGLPGNPVSAAVTFYLFVRTAIMRLAGASSAQLRNGFAVSERDLKGALERDTYLPVTLETDSNGRSIAAPLEWSGSSDFVGFASAEALAIVPAGVAVASGDVVKVLYL